MMTFPRGRPPGRPAAAHLNLNKEFQNSNATTAAFLGGKPKDWMNGVEAPVTSKRFVDVASANTQVSISAANDSAVSAAIPENFSVISSGETSVSSFPPSNNRGRFPPQWKQGGVAKSYPVQPLGCGTHVPAPSVPLSPRTEMNSPVVISKESLDNPSNLPPSPGPSVQTRRQSATIIDLENATLENKTADHELRSQLEELVKRHGGTDAIEKSLLGIRKPDNIPLQHNASPVTIPSMQRDNPASSLASSEQHNPSEIPTTSITSQIDNGAASAVSKRRSESGQAPRKRLQGLPSSDEIPVRVLNTDSGSPTTMSNPHFPQNSDLNVNLEKQMQSFEYKALLRLYSSDIDRRAGSNVERPRLHLLREACERSDYFYLCLHQIYCLDHMRKRFGDPRMQLSQNHQEGLDKLSYLLVTNESLSADAIRWFSEFPLPVDLLFRQSPIWQQGHHKAIQCLMQFARNWEIVRSQCEIRNHPPLVDELLRLFGAESFILHQVIYRALLRDIWPGSQDRCFQNVDEMFQKSYQEAIMRRSANPMIENSAASTQAFVHHFRMVARFHQQHTHQRPGATMPPPQSRPNLQHRHSGQHNPFPTDTTHHPNNRRHSSSSSGVQLPQQNPETGLPIVEAASLTAPSQAPHTSRLNFLSRQGQLTQPDAVVPQNPLLNRTPIATSASRHEGVRRLSTGHEQNSQSGTSAIPRDHQSSVSVLSEGRNPLAQPLSQGFTVPPSLPSNDSSSNPRNGQPIARSHSLQSSQIHPRNNNAVAQPPDGSTRQYTMNGQPSHRGAHIPSTPADGTPFIRENPNLSQLQINPTMNALHQAHVRSPILSSHAHPGKDKSTKYFRCIEHVTTSPGGLSNAKRHISWEFHMDKKIHNKLAQDMPGSYGSISARTLLPASRVCRIRCVKLCKKNEFPTGSEWVVAENVWPASMAIVLNNEALEIRRKSHHGKDLPIDATPYMKEGRNVISAAIVGFSEESVDCYAIGLETIIVLDEPFIRTNIPVLRMQDARQRIINISGNADPDVQILNSQIVLDLTDPFMASIFNVPMRGKSCRHHQCFDRDIFLQTRGPPSTSSSNKPPPDPCSPDEFRCPICGLDARPQNLTIDGFFVHVRGELEKRGRLDVRAIVFDPQTSDWEIKEEEEAVGEQGDGTGMRNRRARTSAGRQSTPRDVIQIHDED